MSWLKPLQNVPPQPELNGGPIFIVVIMIQEKTLTGPGSPLKKRFHEYQKFGKLIFD